MIAGNPHTGKYVKVYDTVTLKTVYLIGGDGIRTSWNSSCGLNMDLQSIVLILLAVLIAYLFRNETK